MNASTKKEISCRITLALMMYVRERNNGSLGMLLDGLALGEAYLSDPNNWVSHAFLQVLYKRMIDILGDESAVYKMPLSIASRRLKSLGLLHNIARLLGSPKFIYAHTAKYNKLLKIIGDIHVHEVNDTWVILEDRYHNSAQKTRYDCDFTRGVLAGIPMVFNLPTAHVEETECQVTADRYGNRIWPDNPKYGCQGCIYRIQYASGEKIPFWKRLYQRHGIYGRAIEDLLAANRKIQEKYDEVKKLASDLEAAKKQYVESKKQLESNANELQASEQRYRLLAENVTDIIWTLSLKTMRFTYASPSVKKIRGFTPEEAMALSLEETLSPQSLANVMKTLTEETAKEGKAGVDPNRTRTMEVQQSCKDGTYAWAEATMTSIRDKQGRPVEILGVTRDITERKRSEEERKQLEDILSQVRKMESIGTLAGGIAHDFNNLLMGIQGRTSLMLLGVKADSPYFEHLKGIETYVKSATELTKQILGFARGGKYEIKPTDMNMLIEKSSEMFGRTKKEINIHRKFQTGIWTVDVDRGQIVQVFVNLYVNAAQSMQEGGDLYLVTENATLNEKFAKPHSIKSGRYVKVSVKDTGEGIDEKTLGRIFEPFFTTKERGRGTGLGLASSYGIIRNHGGMITAKSKEGEGSEFTVYLPATESILKDEIKAEEGILKGDETILLLDDEEMIIEVGKEMLESIGYTVLTALSGKEAIEIYREKKGMVDMVILDMIMPDMGGGETFDRLKSINNDVKVLLSSGYSLDGQANEILNRGCNGFIQKPFRIEEMSQKIREVLDAA